MSNQQKDQENPKYYSKHSTGARWVKGFKKVNDELDSLGDALRQEREKKMSEEAEQLDETSKERLKAALKAAIEKAVVAKTQSEKNKYAHHMKVLAGGLAMKENVYCRICGQTPCNCTHIKESTAYHRVSVTVSDPNHPAVSQRKDKVEKTVRVKGDEEGAVEKAKAHFKKKGYKVHDANYIEGYDISQEDNK